MDRAQSPGSTRPSWLKLVCSCVAVSLVAAAFVATSAEPGFGHTPHDQISDVAVSPSFATDHTVFTISDGRPLRSTDGGKHWVEMQLGLSGEGFAQFAFSPVDPKIMYLSSRGSGVFRSDDAGRSWRRTNTRATPAYTSDIVVSRSSSDVVVADDGLLGGLSRTTDGGATWTPVPEIVGAKAVTFVPGKAGHVVVGEKNGSLWVSHDDGSTFSQAGAAAGGASIMSLAVGPEQSASTVFAGTNKGEVLVSTDAGDSWSKLGPGIPNEEITGLVPSSGYATDKTLWASTSHRGPYRSTDGAKTWTPAAKGVTTDPQADDLGYAEFGSIVVVPDSGNRQLYLVGYDGLFRSSDGGARWAQLQTLTEYLTGLAVSPDYANDGTVVASSYVKGMFISRDGGRTFVGSNSGLGTPLAEGNKYLPVYRMHNVAFSPGYASDHTIFTATWTKFAKSTDGGRTWTLTVVAPKPKGKANLQQYVIAVSPSYTTDHTIFMGTRYGEIWRSTKAGAARSWTHVGDVGLAVRSLVVSPDFAKDRTLFAGSTGGVFTSVDAGATWKATGPKAISLLAISSDYAHDGTVFAGTPRGLYETRDGGKTWTASTNAPVSSTANVAGIALSPDFARDGTVLVSVEGVGLFRSTDRGNTFAAAGASLLDHDLVIRDFQNPTSEPIQFSPTFATDHTVYGYAQQSVVRSTDGGVTWTVLDIPPSSEFAGAKLRPGIDAASPSTARASGANGNGNGDSGVPVVPIAIAVVVIAAAGAILVAYRRRASRAV